VRDAETFLAIVGAACSACPPSRTLKTMRALFGFLVCLSLSAQSPPPRPKVFGVAHYSIFVSDLARARTFYEDFLGYEESFTLPKADGAVQMAFVKINDHQYLELVNEPNKGEGQLNHLGLYTDDVERMRQYLASQGVKVPDRVTTNRIGNRKISVVDPDGHTVEIVEYLPDSWTGKDTGKHMPVATLRRGHVCLELDRFPPAGSRFFPVKRLDFSPGFRYFSCGMGVPAVANSAGSNGFGCGGRMCAASEIAWICEVAARLWRPEWGERTAMSALPCPVADPFAAAGQAYATITEFLHSKEACQVKHSELERQLEGMGRELMRKLLQAHLDMRQPGQAVEPVRDAAGTPLTPTPVHGRSLESIFGTVEVARTGYGAAGTPSLHPLDGALNLPPEKYSLEVRRRVAMEAAKSSFDEGVKTLEVYTGAHVPKRQFEELVIRAAQDFEAFYQERQARARAGPQTGSILVLTVDGKGVAMRPEDLREATQRAAAARAKTFTARLGKGRRLHAKPGSSLNPLPGISRVSHKYIDHSSLHTWALQAVAEHFRRFPSLAQNVCQF
jgi:catechol 2,3-dioxygenase-like lactoylglutathione lyase family enzyme